MPVLSHLHQLFNAEQCHAYIHTLRWKDRPLHCPRCQSHHIGRWGTYQGLVRDTCNFRPQGGQSGNVDLLGQKIHDA